MPLYNKEDRVSLCDLIWEHAHGQLKFFATLYISLNESESSANTDYGVTNKF